MTWQCVKCETSNPDTVNACEVCETKRPYVLAPVYVSPPPTPTNPITEPFSLSKPTSLFNGWGCFLTIFFVVVSLWGGYLWGRSNLVTIEAESASQQATLEAQRILIDNTSATLYDFSSLLSTTKVGNTLKGDLAHDPNDNSVVTDYSAAELINFVTEVRFYNPSNGSWDYGIGFRSTAGNEQYRLQVLSNQTWILGYWNEGNGGISVDEGSLENLDVSENGSNHIRLVVMNEKGWFFLNGDYIAKLDLSKKTARGNIWVGTGFFVGDEITGKITKYDGFTVWSLP